MKKIAIMQPYFFPYAGYFQLLHAVEEFISLDNVDYIKNGWINRNKVNSQNGPFYIRFPLEGSSSNRKIHTIRIFQKERAKEKFRKSIISSYRKSQYFEEVMIELDEILKFETSDIAEFNYLSSVSYTHLTLPTILRV